MTRPAIVTASIDRWRPFRRHFGRRNRRQSARRRRRDARMESDCAERHSDRGPGPGAANPQHGHRAGRGPRRDQCDHSRVRHISLNRSQSLERVARGCAIGAAHYALTHLFPAQTAGLDAARSASLAAHELGEGDPGIELGEAVAAAIWAMRSDDGASTAQFPYTAPGAGTPGVWVPSARPRRHAWMGPGRSVGHPHAAQFRPDEPPALDSRRYARDYNEVKELGSLTSTRRTAEQTEIARFWLASPAALWNPIADRSSRRGTWNRQRARACSR